MASPPVELPSANKWMFPPRFVTPHPASAPSLFTAPSTLCRVKTTAEGANRPSDTRRCCGHCCRMLLRYFARHVTSCGIPSAIPATNAPVGAGGRCSPPPNTKKLRPNRSHLCKQHLTAHPPSSHQSTHKSPLRTWGLNLGLRTWACPSSRSCRPSRSRHPTRGCRSCHRRVCKSRHTHLQPNE